MGVLHFFKNKMKQFKKTDMMKVISDLTIPDIQNMNEFDESLSYKTGEKVFYYDRDEDRYVILIATKDIDPGKINLDDWKISLNHGINETMTIIDSNLVQKTYSIKTTKPNQKIIKIPKSDYNPNTEVFIISINTSVVIEDNYILSDIDKTITFKDGSNYDNLVANTQIDFIFFSTIRRKVKTSLDNIESINLDGSNRYEYTIKTEDIDVEQKTVSFSIDTYVFNPVKNSLLLFVEGVLLTENQHYIVNGNTIKFLFLLNEGSLVSFIVQHNKSLTGKYGEILPVSTLSQAIDGVDDYSIMTPLKVNEKIKHVLKFASDDEAIDPTINNKIMTPHTSKLAMDKFVRDTFDEINKETVILDIKCSNGASPIGQYINIKNLTDGSRSITYKIKTNYNKAFVEPGDSYVVSVNKKYGYNTPSPITFDAAVKGRTRTCTMVYTPIE